MRILIVEDERVAARGLEQLLRSQLGARIESLRIEAGLTASQCFVEDNPIDVLFLDLNLRGEDGLQLLRMAAAASFQTVIVSANTDRAVVAFEYGVIDFIPKPVEPDRLAAALRRLENGLPIMRREMSYISIRKDERAELIPLKKIAYIQAADNYVDIHLFEGTREKHRKTMDALMNILPANFLRTHRSFIVNIDFVSGLRHSAGGKYELELKSSATLPISRNYYQQLKTRIIGPQNEQK